MRLLVLALALLALVAPVRAQAPQASDTSRVRDVVAAYGAAWNAHDMDALAATFADDAHWVNIVGMWWRGKAAVVAAHAAYHDTMFRDVPFTPGAVDVREVAPGVAVAVATMRMGAFTTPDGHPVPAADNRLTLVLAHREGQWLIVSGQNTVVDPVAAAFDPVNR